MRVLAIANHKGGVGKTASAVNIPAALAVIGHRVLLIDLDPQGGATRALGKRVDDADKTLFSVLLGDTPLTDIILSLDAGFDLAPSHLNLAALHLHAQAAPAQRLAVVLRDNHEALSQYDYIFLDCPPNLDIMLQNALAAASDLFIPVNMEPPSLLVLGEFFAIIRESQRFANRALRVRGFIPNAVNERLRLARGMRTTLAAMVPNVPILSPIRNTVRVSEAPGKGLTIFQHAPNHEVCGDYRRLAHQMVEITRNGHR